VVAATATWVVSSSSLALCFLTQFFRFCAAILPLKMMYLAAFQREFHHFSFTDTLTKLHKGTLERLKEEEARATKGNDFGCESKDHHPGY